MVQTVYTKDQLDQMNDYELNKAAKGKELVLRYGAENTDYEANVFWVKSAGYVGHVVANPIENFNDCMPIATKHAFQIKPALIKNGVVEKWAVNDRKAEIDSLGFTRLTNCAVQDTLQKAIVYCFLMMEV